MIAAEDRTINNRNSTRKQITIARNAKQRYEKKLREELKELNDLKSKVGETDE